jgi:FkbM family methyltransferase
MADGAVTAPFDIDAARAAIAGGASFVFQGIDVVACTIAGRPFRFAVDMERDPIQRHHRTGQLYEGRELGLIKRVMPLGGTYVDIGANVGNHALYVAAFLSPMKVIPFEPNVAAYKLLLANVAMNGFGGVFDLSWLGLGLSDKPGEGFAMERRTRNLGASRMLPGQGELRVVTGDEALAGENPDFIKIDVESMELQVLNGLDATLKRCGPWMLIEVDKHNDKGFHDWLNRAEYVVDTEVKRYETSTNYLVRPAPRKEAQ